MRGGTYHDVRLERPRGLGCAITIPTNWILHQCTDDSGKLYVDDLVGRSFLMDEQLIKRASDS